MKIKALGQVATVALAGSIALAGCGSDNTTNTSSSSGSSSASGSSEAIDCFSGQLNPEGSSAQKNAIEEAISSFGEKCKDAKIEYNPSGSGTGIKQFIAGQVAWAGSDSALKTEPKAGETESEAQKAAAFCGSPAWNLPMVTGPIAVAYNLEGVDKLVMTPAVLAGIFSGTIKTWNDPKIVEVNKDAKLPAEPIKVFFRAGESGTTENFTKYLKASAGDAWTKDPGKVWTGTGEGKDKSSGVAEGVKSTPGGITYVEWSYAKDNNLGIAQVDNGAGPVELTGETVGKSVATAKQTGEGNDLALKLDYATKEAGAYPIILVTYEIVCSKNKDAEKGKQIKAFLKHFASADVQKSLEGIGYAPLPQDVESKVLTAIDALS